jgi:transposase
LACMRPSGPAEDLEARRRRAVKLLGEGWLIQDVAAAVGASRQSVSNWKKLAGTRGETAKALAAKPQHVPQCRLSPRERAELVRLLRAGPRKAGFDSDLWTTGRVAELVEQKFGESYHPTHIGRMMHALGFSCQKPQRRSKEQNPEAVQAWREQKWPRIKKGRTRAS